MNQVSFSLENKFQNMQYIFNKGKENNRILVDNNILESIRKISLI